MDFNWKIYRELNKDLEDKLQSKLDYIKHYELHGKKEGRKKSVLDIQKDFNVQYYLYNYEDLRNLSVEDAEFHYVQNGIKENRLCNRLIQNVYIVFNIEKGGSVKYTNDLVNGFSKVRFKIIGNRRQLYETVFTNKDLVFIVHLLHTNITPMDITQLKKRYNFRLIISIHDFYWLNLNLWDLSKIFVHNSYLMYNDVLPEVKELFNISNEIIHPSKFTYNTYNKYFMNTNSKIIYHNDALVKQDILNVPYINNNIINIGFLHQFLEVKGSEFILKLLERYKFYKDYKISYYIVGKNIRPYEEKEYFEYIKKLNLHCLTFLSKYGETWSYSLTKALNTGLPIIYNNFGSFKERIPIKEHYFKVHDYESEIDNNEKLYDTFEKLLDFIILNNGKIMEMNEDTTIIYNHYYHQIFNSYDS